MAHGDGASTVLLLEACGLSPSGSTVAPTL
jgi:hypothetical protein